MYSKSSSFPQNSTSGREFIIKRKFLKTAWILVSSEKLPSINCNSDWWARLLLTLNLLSNLIQQITQQTFVSMKTSWRRLSSSSSKDVFKTSSRRLDEDEYILINHTSSEDVFKTSSRRLGQDQYIRLVHTSSRRLQDIFKTFWRRFEGVFKLWRCIMLFA